MNHRLLWIAVLCASARAGAQEKSPACELLTVDEVKSALGEATGGKGTSLVVDKGSYKGETLFSCMWGLGTRGGLNLHLTRAPKNDAEREGFQKLMHRTTERLEAGGWKLERKAFGSSKCLTATPPATQADAGLMVGCMAEAKGKGLSIGTMGRGLDIDMPKMKALLDKALARLP